MKYYEIKKKLNKLYNTKYIEIKWKLIELDLKKYKGMELNKEINSINKSRLNIL